MTSCHLKKLTRLLEMSGGEGLRKKHVFVKIVEAVKPTENVDGS